MPAVAPLNATGAVKLPAHTTWLAGWFTVGVGLTVMVKLTPVPPQPLDDGVTVIVAVTATAVVLVAVKLGILPVPLGARPIEAPVWVQLNTSVPPVLGLVNTTAAVGEPLHTTWLATGFTTGVGFTVIVNDTGLPVQLAPPLV